MSMTSLEYIVTVVSSGSGYSHPQSTPIKLKINFPSQSHHSYYENNNVTVGIAVLSPSGVARLQNFFWRSTDTTTGLKYAKGKVSVPQRFIDVPTGGTLRAYLVSPTDPTIQLTTTPIFFFGSQIPAQTFSGRKSCGYVVIEVDEVFEPDPTIYPSSTVGLVRHDLQDSSFYGYTTEPVGYLNLYGNEPTSVLPSGDWSILHSVYNPPSLDGLNSFPPSHSVLQLNSPTEESYSEYSISTSSVGGVTYSNGGYTGGRPHLPLGIKASYGWSDTSRLYTEHKRANRHPHQVWFSDLNHANHKPPASPVQPTIIIEARDGVGSGLAATAVFTEANSDADFTTYSVSLNVISSGSGYVYEPYVAASLWHLSPTRVGGDSDWKCVKAVASLGSAGTRSDGWPMVWGTGFNNSYSPQRLGFSIDIKSLSTEKEKQWLGQGVPRLPGLVRSKLIADTVGGYPTDPVTSDALSIAGDWYGQQLFNANAMLGRCLFWGETGANNYWSLRTYFPLYVRGPYSVASRCYGLSYGIYAATPPTDSATKALFPPNSWNGYEGNKYRVFMQPPPENDLFTPLKIPTAISDIYYSQSIANSGSCYTKAPDLGPDYSCTLVAPQRIKSFSFVDRKLYGLDENNELWFLRGESSDSRTIDIREPQKETLKGLKLNAEVSWKWSVDEYDVDVYYQSYDEGSTRNRAEQGKYGPDQIILLETIKQNRMSAPVQKVTPDQGNGYVNTVDVLTNYDWDIVITNPGSGYKIDDSITFTIKSPQTVLFERTYAFDSQSVTTQDFDAESLSISYTGVGYLGAVGGLKSTHGSTDPWKPRPYSNQFAAIGVYKDNVTSSKVTQTVQVIKESKWKLIDEYKPTLINYNDVSITNPLYRGFSTITVADGGLYKSLCAPITLDTIFGKGTVELTASQFVNRSGFLTKVPDVVVSGGSGSGCTAKLVPATGMRRNSPHKVTAAVTKHRGPIASANPRYAVSSSDGSLISVVNPLVSVPDSYKKGFDSLSSYFGRTSGGDFYSFGGELDSVANYASIEMRRPTAQLNLELTIDNAGEDYQLPPVFSIPQPSSEIAVVDAVIDGKLIALGVEYPGSGYRYPPTLTIVGGEGSGATAEAVISGPVDTVTVIERGSGYAAAPFVELDGNGSGGTASVSMKGGVSKIVLIDGGSGYLSTPEVVISGGGGSGATATASMKQTVTRIAIDSRTGEYTSVPSVVISGGGGSGATAVARAEFNSATGRYYISSILVTNKGEGYTSTPTVTVSQEIGASIAAYAVMDNYIDSLQLTNAGSGYSTPPAVLLNGNASASAFLSLRVDSVSVLSGGTYRSPPSVSFEPVFTVESILLNASGGGYITAPEVQIICPRGIGAGATAQCQLKPDGTIKRVILTARGSGYIQSAPPVVLFFGGGGHGAAATASIAAIGSGASAATTINGSILFARAVQGGSNYQFSPDIIISGGGNTALAGLQARLSSGAIDSEEYENQSLAIRGRVKARIEGPISQLNIVNAGDKYVKAGTATYGEYSTGGVVSPVDLNGVIARAYCFSVVGSAPSGWGGEIDFEAPSQYPGGPISQPASLPTAKFNQKPQIQFLNSVGIHVEGYHACTRTAIGMCSVLTRQGPLSYGAYGYNYTGLDYLKCKITSGLCIKDGVVLKEWRMIYDNGSVTVGYGFSGFAFNEVPRLKYGGSSGFGAVVESTTDSNGKITGTYFSATGSGYSTDSTLSMTRGVIRFTPCTATCTISATGGVASIAIKSPGEGYMNPVVVIHGGGGTGATATAVRKTLSDNPWASGAKSISGEITSITVLSSGTGYSASNPPQVFVYDATGYLSDTAIGKAVAESLNGWLYSFGKEYYWQGYYVVQWSSEESEYCPVVPHEYKTAQPAGPWFDLADRYTNYYLTGYPSGSQFNRFPVISSREYYGNTNPYHEHFRGFGYADYISTLFISANTGLLRQAYSSPPVVTIKGSCKTQMQASSAVAKWDSNYSVNGAVLSAIRTDQ
jgi:hypothetical protein